MTTQIKYSQSTYTITIRNRELAARKLDEWRKRNAKRLKGWNPVRALRF